MYFFRVVNYSDGLQLMYCRAVVCCRIIQFLGLLSAFTGCMRSLQPHFGHLTTLASELSFDRSILPAFGLNSQPHFGHTKLSIL